ncbi:MAG: class I SAM-dependent methyltransferase [Lachnospiraceae bacterium]|jgi:tRNA (adenine22-N1)-methyltransferase|nr:class I SAM-dependent methyltransferase [Lachnospiraceae bacterium]
MKEALSNRLLAIAGMVTKGESLVLADIGTDHAGLPIHLCRINAINAAIALDFNEGPLKIARKNILEAGLSDRIDVRKSDGFSALKSDEAQIAVIAGIGGALTIRILKDGEEVLEKIEVLILEPQSEIEKVREYLWREGYIITDEDMIFEQGKYYPIIKAIHGNDEAYDEVELRYGRRLLKEKNKTLKDLIYKELNTLGNIFEELSNINIVTESVLQRQKEVKHQIDLAMEAMGYYVSKNFY